MSSSEETDRDDDALPAKSKTKYLLAYDHFMKWRTENKEESFSEEVFLLYFNEISKYRKVAGLWAIYAMLKRTFIAKHDINLGTFGHLRGWLRRKSVGYQSVQSKILTEDDIYTFLYEAPDETYLATKVALILGICGGCHAVELTYLTTKNIKTVDNVMLCIVHDTRNSTDKMFVIKDEFIPIVNRYQELRPKDIKTDRFFLSFRDGSCTRQVIGRHKMLTFPREIATYLELPNPELYSGRCFKRSSAAFGAMVKNIKKRPKRQTTELASDNEIAEIVKSAKRYKRANVKDTTVDVEVENLMEEVPIDTKDTELTADTMPIKTEEIEILPNEVYFKIEEEDSTNDFLSTMTSEINMPTTSNPTASVRTATEMAMDSEDDSEDLVQIKTDSINRKTTLDSFRKETSQETSSPHDTMITVAGKNITIIFKNCSNVGNVTVNVINK